MNPKFKLIKENSATLLGTHTNDKGQLLEFYEHPLNGQDSPVIVCFPSEQVAVSSNFYELDDMTEFAGEYEPYFEKNTFGDWCMNYNCQI